MPGVTDSFRDDKQVLTAVFPTLGGANLAVKTLEEAEKKGLLDVDNTVTVSKNFGDRISVNETTGDSAKHGAKVGAVVGGIVGLIFPPSLLASVGLGAAVGAMTGKLRASNFDDSQIKEMADSLEVGQSMLVAIVDPKSKDEIETALAGMATQMRWAMLSGASKLHQELSGN